MMRSPFHEMERIVCCTCTHSPSTCNMQHLCEYTRGKTCQDSDLVEGGVDGQQLSRIYVQVLGDRALVLARAERTSN